MSDNNNTKISPPMTATASGCRSSEPAPKAGASGSIPNRRQTRHQHRAKSAATGNHRDFVQIDRFRSSFGERFNDFSKIALRFVEKSSQAKKLSFYTIYTKRKDFLGDLFSDFK